MPEKFTPEQMGKMEDSRTLSDAELIKGGAGHAFDEKGEKNLILTENQKMSIHNEMMVELDAKEKKEFFENKEFYQKYMRNSELSPEKEDDSKKFDKLFLDMDKQLLHLNDLIISEASERINTDVDILKKAVNGGLEKMFKLDGEKYCCVKDTGYSKEDDAFKPNYNANTIDQTAKRWRGNKNIGLATERLFLEILKITITNAEYKLGGSGADIFELYSLTKNISKKIGVPQNEVAIGIMNRLKKEQVMIDGDKIKIEEAR